MPREYVVGGDNIAVANQPVTLAFVNPESTRHLKIRRCWIGFAANATPAQQRVQLVTQGAPFPALIAVTPVKLRQADGASLILPGAAGAAGTCGINASNEGTGPKTLLVSDVFNVVNGWSWEPPDDLSIIMTAGGGLGFGLHLPAAPATLTGWSFGILYREVQ
jgi:hypothetical protein